MRQPWGGKVNGALRCFWFRCVVIAFDEPSISDIDQQAGESPRLSLGKMSAFRSTPDQHHTVVRSAHALNHQLIFTVVNEPGNDVRVFNRIEYIGLFIVLTGEFITIPFIVKPQIVNEGFSVPAFSLIVQLKLLIFSTSTGITLNH